MPLGLHSGRVWRNSIFFAISKSSWYLRGAALKCRNDIKRSELVPDGICTQDPRVDVISLWYSLSKSRLELETIFAWIFATPLSRLKKRGKKRIGKKIHVFRYIPVTFGKVRKNLLPVKFESLICFAYLSVMIPLACMCLTGSETSYSEAPSMHTNWRRNFKS